MKWLLAFFANLQLRRSASANPAFVHSAPTPAAYGPVSLTETPQRNGGAPISDLPAIIARRGQKLHNRSSKASIYERTNMILARGVKHV